MCIQTTVALDECCFGDDRHASAVVSSTAVTAVQRGSTVLKCHVVHWTPGSVYCMGDLEAPTTCSRVDGCSFQMPLVAFLH